MSSIRKRLDEGSLTKSDREYFYRYRATETFINFCCFDYIVNYNGRNLPSRNLFKMEMQKMLKRIQEKLLSQKCGNVKEESHGISKEKLAKILRIRTKETLNSRIQEKIASLLSKVKKEPEL